MSTTETKASAAAPLGPLHQVNWTQLVERIHSGEAASQEELYRIFSKGIRFLFARQFNSDIDDKVHDTFRIVVQAIQRGDIREPERLMGFVRTVVRRQIVSSIDKVVQKRRELSAVELSDRLPDRRSNPEQSLAFRRQVELMKTVLREMSEPDREILTRFYLGEQTQEQICEELDLTETQFRLLKSRAKARFGQLGKKKLQHKALSNFMRMSQAG